MNAITFYPKLKTALNGHWELLKGRSFDDIDKAAKLQATQGDKSAVDFLKSAAGIAE